MVVDQGRQYARYFGVDVVAQEGGVDTRVGGYLLLIERLDNLQGILGRIGVFLVALDLQTGQVEEPGWGLFPLFGDDIGHGKGEALDFLQEILSLLLALEPPLGYREGGVAVDGFQLPVRLGNKVLYLELPVDNQGQRRGLYPTDGEYLPVLPVFEGIKPGGIHAQQPVADGP